MRHFPSRTLVCRCLFVATTSFAWPGALWAQTTVPDTLALEGCYALTYRDTARPFDGSEYERRVWLTTVQLEAKAGEFPRFVMRPAPKERASPFEASYWVPHPNGQSAVLHWTSGFHGVTMELAVDRSKPGVLQGEARTYTDVLGSPPATARVTATPFDCLG